MYWKNFGDLTTKLSFKKSELYQSKTIYLIQIESENPVCPAENIIGSKMPTILTSKSVTSDSSRNFALIVNSIIQNPDWPAHIILWEIYNSVKQSADSREAPH